MFVMRIWILDVRLVVDDGVDGGVVGRVAGEARVVRVALGALHEVHAVTGVNLTVEHAVANRPEAVPGRIV
jgi:hypothetical protein